jgi:hypothetical protein
MRWIAVVLLAIIGVLAAIAAAIYLAVPIHSLPSFVPGQHSGGGTYHKRGAVAALISLVAFVAAGGLAVYFRRPAATYAPGRPAQAAPPEAGRQQSA